VPRIVRTAPIGCARGSHQCRFFTEGKADNAHRTQHWTWEFLNPDGRRLGKKNVINNFCTSVASNYASCTTCHMTEGHQVPGSRYAPTAQDKGGAHLRGKEYTTNPTTCQACHGRSPHMAIAKLNDHTDKVAFQACHIPA